MLPRQHKLSRATFPAYKDPRLNWVGSVLRIQAYPSVVLKTPHENEQGKTVPLFAVVVAKRFAKSAVLRHAFKRQILRIVAVELLRFKALPYGKYVVSPKGALAATPFPSIVKDVEDFLLQRKK